MSKKKGEPVLPAVPEVEDDVALPDEVEPVPEPSFCFVLGHLTGHAFVVEEPPPVAVEGEDPPQVPSPPQVKDFDPSELITTKAKEAVDPLLKKIICIEREDLQLVANAEEKTLAEALKARLVKERAARHRRKHNDARKAAIAAFEAAKTAVESGDVVADGSQPDVEEKFKADTLVLIRDFPSSQQELEEISAMGLCSEGIIDLWAAVYITGESLGELPVDAVADEDGEFPERPVLVLEPPDMVRFFYDGIHAAALDTELSNCTVCTLPRSHTLAFPPPEVQLVDHVTTAILEAVGSDALSRQKYGQWLRDAEREKPVPALDREEQIEKRLYERMIGSVDPLHHDIPLFLHCLTDQVELTCSKKAGEHEEKVALDNLNQFLGDSCLDILSGGIEPMRRPQSRDGPTSPKSAKSMTSTPCVGNLMTPGNVAEDVLLPCLDQALCSHSLAGGGMLENGEPIVEVVHRILKQVSAPGVKRSGLPHDAAHSAAQREALKTRIYPFAPMLPPCEFEQLLLLHAFEDLLNKAQPERKWRLSDRTYHERIPKELLAQTLDAALQCEPFVSTVYIPRHDCLLVALHYRSLAGRVMWHTWKGDLFSPSDSKRWSRLMTMPTFNDWAKIVGGSIEKCHVPQACRLLEEMDGRELGYTRIIEKLATPSDKSIILVTRFEHGINGSFPFPTAEVFKPIEDNTATILDGESAYDLESVLMFQGASKPTLAEQRFDSPARHSSRLARVMKDGLAFGIVHDATWGARRQEERTKRIELAKKTEMEAGRETEGSRPSSPPAVEATAPSRDIPLPFAAQEFGHFWVSFADGARCSVRMHHEKEPFPATEDFLSGSVTHADEKLGPVGAMLTYSLAVGLVVQVFSDGAVRFTWPLALEAREDGPAIAPVAMATTAPRLPAGNRPHFMPGCPEDIEITRTITPFGAVIRKLLSGRVEVYHPDSTTAVRNPTLRELDAQVNELRTKHGRHGSSRLELLERFCKVYAASGVSEPTRSFSEKEKAAGLPGHWVVVRPDGFMSGRADPDVYDAQRPISEAVGIDGVMQYPISTGVSVATQVDLQTGHRTRTNSHGLACYEDPDGKRTICDHADGTRVTKIRREGGHDILISKETMSYVKCEFNNSPSGVELRVVADCMDGTQIEIVPQSKDMRPLGPNDADNFGDLSTHAWVHLKRPEIANILSRGDGGVDIFTGADMVHASEYGSKRTSSYTYAAQCANGCITMQDREGQQFVLKCDQTLSVVGGEDTPGSPRCTAPETAYAAVGIEDQPPPPEVLPPRLFVVYGNGDAEELLSDTDAVEILNVAKADPQSNVIEGEIMEAPLEGCRCHTIFSTRPLDGYVKPPALQTESVMVSLGSLDAGWSKGSVPAASSLESPPTLTKYRQMIEFPSITEENHQMFLGTLKQYRQWEQAELLRNRAIMAGPEDKKGKAQDKKKAEKASKKDEKKRSRRSKRHSAQVEPAEIIELILPKFVEDLNLPVFDHAVDVLRIRQATKPEPTNKQLLAKALPSQEVDLANDDDGTADLNTMPTEPDTSVTSPHVVPNIEGISSLPPPLPEETWVEPEQGSGDMTLMKESPPADNDESSRPVRPKVSDAPIFHYFKSDMGLQFLLDNGEMDPERRPQKVARDKSKNLKQGFAPAKRSPWNPTLLGEDISDEPQGNESQVEGEERESRVRTRTEVQAEQEVNAEMESPGRQTGVGKDLRDMPYTPQARLPIVAEDADTPMGPHPDKKGNLWDIYGNPRKQRPVASHAYVMLNTNYLEVEGATDRRVRTSSISHKKNSAKAPSVSSVRKTGQHALGTGTELAAQDILGDLGLSNPEEHWKLTSTMQGLGDSNNLVEVTPGTCRFGLLRQGGVYRMAFFLRNLDVDVTRFNVGRVSSELVHVIHQPGHIAPGMAAKVTVEIRATEPATVEQLVEVRMKAHVVRVPVTARILEAEEYDRRDTTSFSINQRYIGRHREKSDAGEKRAVEVVADENYCKKVLGEKFLPPPADCEETPMH